MNLPPEELPIHQITVVGLAIATDTALVTEVGVQVECTISDYLSKEKQVELPIILFHPSEGRFTNQTTNIKHGSNIFFSGALTLIEDKLYLELQNFSFVRNNQTASTKQMPWSSKKASTTSTSSTTSTNIARSIHNFNKKSPTLPTIESSKSSTPITPSPTIETSKSSTPILTSPTLPAADTIAQDTPIPKTTGRKPKNPPTPTSLAKRKTRSSYKPGNKAQKLADIATNIISVVDSDHEELED